MSSSSRSSNTTNNNTTNYNLQGTNAQSVVAGNNNTVTTTDHGAIEAGLTIATQAMTSNQTVNMASMDHVVSMAESANNSILEGVYYAVDEVADAWSSSSQTAVNSAGQAVDEISKAWSSSTAMVVQETNSAAALVAKESAANSDRVERMAKAVSTNGQNLMADNNMKVLYVVGGVSAAAVLGFAFLARSK